MSGTARSFSADVRDLLERRLAEVAAGIAQAGGCTAESKYLRRYPALVNSVEQTSLAVEAAAMTVGRDKVDPNTPRISGAEDFAFMLEKKPGAYIMIGNGGPDEGGCHNVHSPLYDFNDRILTTGAAYWVNLVQVELGNAALIMSPTPLPSGEVVPSAPVMSQPAPQPEPSCRWMTAWASTPKSNDVASSGAAGLEHLLRQAIGEGRQRDQRIVGDNRGGDLLVVAGHAVDMDVARLAEHAVDRRAVGRRFVVAGVHPARLRAGVDRKFAAIEFDQVNAD